MDKFEEPARAYGFKSPFTRILYSIDPSNENDTVYMKLSREGVDKSSLKELADYLGLTQEVISGFLHTSLRNIQRKNDNEKLDIVKSEKVMELAAFAKKATIVLGDREALVEWLQSPLMALNFEKPISYLDNTFGINILYKVLGRIEHGVYS